MAPALGVDTDRRAGEAGCEDSTWIPDRMAEPQPGGTQRRYRSRQSVEDPDRFDQLFANRGPPTTPR
jgi:hypothetical protein